MHAFLGGQAELGITPVSRALPVGWALLVGSAAPTVSTSVGGGLSDHLHVIKCVFCDSSSTTKPLALANNSLQFFIAKSININNVLFIGNAELY